ncbi:MAG TPA: HAD-IIIC family phosphatase [Acidobacteriaceae bacterium]|nr:HAD-IIIC family phosphatase [Acidobacteriaceae bacterium]
MGIDQLSAVDLLLKRKSLRRQFGAAANLQPVRIAVLGGSTTNEVVDLLEILLLASGFKPEFHQSEYGRFYEDTVVDPADLISFAPDIVYLHTSYLNVRTVPPANSTAADRQACVDAELWRYQQIWQSIEQNVSAQIIQNNFELPPYATFGNMDSSSNGGATRFFLEMNAAFARAAEADPRLLLHDIHRLSSRIGLNQWFDWTRYFSYKILVTSEASLAMARSIASMVRGIYGKSRKVLVLDLDNTLWGGVIGDDGIDNLQIGRETPVAEAYTAFQEYCLSLQRRGILLAVCSKNDEKIAKQGFEHPDSVLKLEHFSSFKANWEPKSENILAIAKELNLGVDSFVFVDDNPAERAIVEAQIPEIAVPDVGSDVTRFATLLDEGRYFEPVSMSQEDLSRAALYQANAARSQMESKFANYGEYLDSLEMTAEIERFNSLYLDRIVQLTNKANQFNLTTRRYTVAEMEGISRNGEYIGIYGKLSDRFGDNGLVSVILGRREYHLLHLDLWLMSCRVLKRDMELAMLDAIVQNAFEAGVRVIQGYYLPTKKNGMVADHYEKLGFRPVSVDPETKASIWSLDISDYTPRNRHIKVLETVRG